MHGDVSDNYLVCFDRKEKRLTYRLGGEGVWHGHKKLVGDFLLAVASGESTKVHGVHVEYVKHPRFGPWRGSLVERQSYTQACLIVMCEFPDDQPMVSAMPTR